MSEEIVNDATRKRYPEHSVVPSTLGGGPIPNAIKTFINLGPKTNLVFVGQFRDLSEFSGIHINSMFFVSAVSALITRLRHDLFVRSNVVDCNNFSVQP